MSNISLQTHHFDRIMIIVISLYQCKKNSIHAYSAYITMYMFMLLYIKKNYKHLKTQTLSTVFMICHDRNLSCWGTSSSTKNSVKTRPARSCHQHKKCAFSWGILWDMSFQVVLEVVWDGCKDVFFKKLDSTNVFGGGFFKTNLRYPTLDLHPPRETVNTRMTLPGTPTY